SVAACTNASQFLVYSNLSVSTFGGATLTADQSTFTNNITFSGFAVGGQIRRNGPNVPVYDYVPAGTLPVSVTFTPGDLTNLLTGFSPLFKEATNIVSIAWNDPRCKTNWMAQYTGLVQNLPTAPYSYVGNRGTLGMRNATNANVLLNNFLPVFTPQASNADDRLVTLPIPGIYTNTFYIAKRGYWRSAGELGRVHRSVPWGTIDFRGGAYRVYPQDSVFLDHFTTLAPATNGSAAYIHGRINVNSPSGGANISPIWAALFAGMPLWDGSYMDYAGANLTTTMPFATQMQNFMTARKYNTLSALCSVDQLSNVQSYYASAPAQLNDEAREWFVDRLVNLVSTKGSGNFFTIYAWGQALSGSSTNFSAKRVAGETLIISMVQPQLSTVGPNNFVSLKTVYFRYNPDLEFYDPGFTWTPGTN
ncbi:MAG: hypothetical protein JO317_00760, partial [Verrucomicrobiae bacterium]|nr:hypothetical protein [Verrucomicrobiae bacterium]